MKILLITEGNQKIGFGHLTRCISLYQAFESRGIEPTLIVNGDWSIDNFLDDEKCLKFNWLDDSEKLLSSLKETDVVVIDSYLASYELYKDISNFVRLMVCVDDNKRLEYPKGVVVNGSIYAQDLCYPIHEGVEYLLGSEFVPLRKEFWSSPPRRIFGDLRRLMVTFGGDDIRNMTPQVLELLINKFPKMIKKVVIGKGFKNIEEIEKFRDNKTEFIYYPDASEMKKTMIESDIAISAGGQTLYELASVGTPTIAIAVASNQFNNVKNWHKNGFIEYVGIWKNKNLMDNIIKSINGFNDKNLRSKKSEIGMRAVDGQGALRIINNILYNYYRNQRLILRRAKIEDLDDVYSLSNDDEVRKHSFIIQKIKPDEHENWFKSKIKAEDKLFLILEVNHEFVGQIRFKIHVDEAILSISLVKNYRDLGLGKHALAKALKILKDEYPYTKSVKAIIREDNRKAAKFFEKSNFKISNKIVVNNINSLEYLIRMC